MVEPISVVIKYIHIQVRPPERRPLRVLVKGTGLYTYFNLILSHKHRNVEHKLKSFHFKSKMWNLEGQIEEAGCWPLFFATAAHKKHELRIDL
jgi:hypothetical protein